MTDVEAISEGETSPLNFHKVLTEILAPNVWNDSFHTTALQSMHFKADHNAYCL
jgi:hypothetical protein